MPYTWSTNATRLKNLFQNEGRVVSDDLSLYIETAELLVADQCLASGYLDVKLELIHLWLSAHAYDTYRPRVAQEGIATGPRQMFEFVKTDLGLNNTKFGQWAMRLDTAGNLAALENSMKKVTKPLNPASETLGVGWLGTAWGDQ